MKIGALYRQIRDQFRDANLETPELDAKLLVSAAFGKSVSDLLLKEMDDAPDASVATALEYSGQRLAGKPVGRILGVREFYGRQFKLNRAALEPRPDTETLIDAVLRQSDPGQPLRMCDIGTGSGAIAVTLLAELPKALMVAVDISEEALICAAENADLNQVDDRFYPVCADYADPLQFGFDWVVSNPPYIRTQVLQELSREVTHHDPNRALDGGLDGLEAYKRIVSRAAEILAPGGRIALEIGYDQAGELKKQLRHHGFEGIDIIQDLGGRDRVATARRVKSR
jgi:release factor glutamine methyltransferase